MSHSVDAWFAVTIDRQTVRGIDREREGERYRERKRRKERLMEGNRDGVEE